MRDEAILSVSRLLLNLTRPGAVADPEVTRRQRVHRLARFPFLSSANSISRGLKERVRRKTENCGDDIRRACVCGTSCAARLRA